MYNNSHKAFDEAKKFIPGGVNSPVRAFKSVNSTPVFFEKGQGSKMFDIDGNEYIDCVSSWGPLIFGHAHESILKSITETSKKGTTYGASTELETLLAKKIVDMVPSIEKVRMVNSGTEATMSAIRLARGYTKKEKIIKFSGNYHGHGDSFLIKAGSGAVTEGTQTTAVGVTHNSNDADLIIALNGVTIDMGDTTANNATNVTTVLAQANVDAALAAGAVLTAKRGYNSSSNVSLTTLVAGATALAGERYRTTAAVTAASTSTGNVYGLGKADEYTLTIGSESVTVSFASDAAATAVAIVDAWDAAWPKDSVVTLSQTGTLNANTTFDVNAVATALDSSAYDLAISISVTDSTTASSITSAALEYTIGGSNSTADNSTDDAGIIVQFTSTAPGATNNSIVSIAAGAGNGAVLDVLTAAEAPTDGSTGVDGVAGAAGTTGVSVNHVGWIS